ncbi:MAG: glycosyltransferase [Planctomycetes bacterium]|nr:glycosyltransferase [Planctomycetota bacterium]
MNTLLNILIPLNGLILGVWIMRLAVLSFASRVLKPLRAEMAAGVGGDLPSVSFIVAAKDEAANIESCLKSLAALEYPKLQIIAVNDRSGDETGAIMDRLSAERDRLEVHHVTHLRSGWFGKNNAMREGVERAEGEWLCFTDADCIQTCKHSLAIAMQYAKDRNADFLSVLPSHERILSGSVRCSRPAVRS